MTLANPTPLSGLFSVTVRLADGDSVERVKAKLAKEVRAIKGEVSLRPLKKKHKAPFKIQIFLYEFVIRN